MSTLTIELRKERRMGIVPVLLAVGVLGAAYAFLNYAVRRDSLLSLPMEPMDILLTQLYGMLTLLNMLGIIVAACLVYNMEFKGNAIRKMHMLPIRLPQLYLCKLSIITVSYGIAEIIQFVALAVIGRTNLPQGSFDVAVLAKFAAYTFVVSLPVISFMVLVSSRAENIWVPLGVGVAGLLSGIALASANVKVLLLHPFVAMFQPAIAMSTKPDGLVILFSSVATLVFSGLGIFLSKQQKLE